MSITEAKLDAVDDTGKNLNDDNIISMIMIIIDEMKG